MEGRREAHDRQTGVPAGPVHHLQAYVTRTKAVVEIEIFEGNLASLREDEMEGLSSADEESD